MKMTSSDIKTSILELKDSIDKEFDMLLSRLHDCPAPKCGRSFLRIREDSTYCSVRCRTRVEIAKLREKKRQEKLARLACTTKK